MKDRESSVLCLSDERERQSFFNDEIIKHQRLIRCVISKILTDPEDIDDAVQECLLQAWTALDRLRNKGALTSWLCTIARNTAFDTLRKKGHCTVSLSEPVTGSDKGESLLWADILISRTPGPEETAITRLNCALFEQAYKMLPKQYRTQLYLRCYLELEVAEINRILGIDEHTRRNAYCRAKQAVRRNYEKLQAK